MQVGIPEFGSVVEPQITEWVRAIEEKTPSRDGRPAFQVVQWGARDAAGSDYVPA